MIALVLWVYLTEKLVSGATPRILNLCLHDWLFICFVPALIFVFIYLYSRKSRTELEARRRVEHALRKSEERYELAMAGANDGVYDWEPLTGHVYYSTQYKAMLGYADHEFNYSFEDLKQLIHPDDLPQVMVRVEDFLAGRSDKYETEFRMRHKDGHYIDVLSRAFLVRGEDGRPLRVVGTHVDITARKRAEALYRSLFDNLRESCTYCRMVYDDDGQPVDFVYLDVNAAFVKQTGIRDAIGKRVTEALPAIRTFTPNIIDIAARVASTGKSEKFESYIASADLWLANSIYCPQKGCFIGIFEDITERKRSEEALRESEQRVRAKLDAILSPGGDIASLELTDILDMPALQLLMDHFFQVAGVPVALVDTNGRVLVGAGWQEICTRFHRVHPETCRFCTESDLALASGIPYGEYRSHKCKNNMFDIATPIWLGERQIASLYAGQFFFDDEQVDEEVFHAQAARYGFDEQSYIEALHAVPRLSRDRIVRAMEFFMELANMISQLSYNRIKLARSLSERITLMDSLREREEIYSAIVNQAVDGIALIDTDTLRFIEFNDATCQAFGFSREEFAALTLPELITDEPPAEVSARIREIARNGGTQFVGKRRHKSGRLMDMNISARAIRLRGREYLSVMWRDITERRKAEDALRVSEQRFRDVSNAAGEFIWEIDASGSIAYTSDRVEAVLGYKPEDLLGHPIFDYMLPSQVIINSSLLADPITRRYGFRDQEQCLVHKSGTPVWVSAAAVPMIGSGGEVIGFRGTTLDITQRKNHEREIERLNRLYATLSEMNKTVTLVRSREELFSEVCRICSEVAGFQVVWIGIIDENTKRVVPAAKNGIRAEYVDTIYVCADESVPEGRGPTGTCIRDGRPCIFNDIIADRRSTPWHNAIGKFGLNACAAFPIRLHGQVIGAFMVYSDERNVFREKEVELLTEAASDICFALENMEREELSRKAEDALRDSEAKFRSYIEHSPMAIFVLDSNGRHVDSNPAGRELLGQSAESIADLTIADVLADSDRERCFREFALLVELGYFASEYEVRRGDGSLISMATRSVRISPDRFICFAVDITDRKRAEEALRDSEARYRGLFENSLDGILMAAAGGRIIAANPTACAMFGMVEKDLCSANRNDLFEQTDSDLAADRRAALGKSTVEQKCIRRDGSRFPVETTSVVLDCGAWEFVMIHDITNRKLAEEERQKLQAQLLQSQKMEAIGQLAGGVAHDFNNLLTVILGYSEMLLAKLPRDNPNRAYVTDIYSSGERAAALTRQLLAFSRKQILAPKILNINSIIANLDKMLNRLIGEDIVLTTSLAENLNPVEVDPTQIEQVVINLAVNARDAMPTGGRLYIETCNTRLDEADCALRPGTRPGPCVLITITDTGCGMNEEVRSKVFEPFFTTKEQGKGTGLGLATVFGIVKQSGGYIDVVSQPGVGTCFRIYLPALSGEAASAEQTIDDDVTTGSETILLVEDEDAVRRIARLALETHGYHVLEAPDGLTAVRIACRLSTRIDLLVTDIVMPEMGGRELVENLRGIRPGLKALYISGYTDDAILRHGVLSDNAAYLQKPFPPVALARRVRQILDGHNN
ncbi:MAG: PAS domain S-box protein [Candidatus Sumerlaeia bacterium]